MPAFTNSEGQVTGTCFDPIWVAWTSGLLPTELGEHEVDLELKNGWGHEVDGAYRAVTSLSAKVRVVALVLTYQGQYVEHSLLHPSSQTVEKWRVDARFDIPGLPITTTQVATEDELQRHFQAIQGLRMITGRVLLPRIDVFTRFGNMFWPPSDKSAEKMRLFSEALNKTGNIDPEILGGRPIDERNVETIFEPVWGDYPVRILGRTGTEEDPGTETESPPEPESGLNGKVGPQPKG